MDHWTAIACVAVVRESALHKPIGKNGVFHEAQPALACRQLRHTMPPEPGECPIVRLSSFSRPRGSTDQQQGSMMHAPSAPCVRGAASDLAAAAISTATLIRGNPVPLTTNSAAYGGEISDDGSISSHAVGGFMRSGSSAPLPHVPNQNNRRGGVDSHSNFEGQQPNQPVSSAASPTHSMSGVCVFPCQCQSVHL
jgi:hypothetical protein